MQKANLEETAKKIRADILKMIYTAQSGHPGGSLSLVEILIALYYDVANIDPANPNKEDRDRIVLSKGHGCPALYAILANKGYFPIEDLKDFRQVHSHLQGHPDMKKTPGVDANTGSLGQGVSISTGMALAAKHRKMDYKVYAIIGDGEVQEGLVWEAAMASAHYKLDNLVVILDHNGLQIDGSNDDVLSIGDIMEKYRVFGFECFKVDGHDLDAIHYALKAPVSGKPKFICCETHKGNGISFMEDEYGWHGKAPNQQEFEKAMEELGVTING
ncbi:transketolase [Bacillus sp. 1NLA3E]|uniref:transketolase n=1 Tax=Bacillus sp. 1NLA3E TaxID=666686 RepID=UPI000247E49D|nr:transketolase [Bacillus sp. 1NLA3E]AGK55943.1 transketolase [Bacillus sp. 1NLA3E]